MARELPSETRTRRPTAEADKTATHDEQVRFYDPRRGDQPVRLSLVEMTAEPVEPARTNYFSIYRIAEGAGRFWANDAVHRFAAPQLLFFTPYQHIRFAPTSAVQGELVQFHANFLCVETFHAEVGCSGTLFNDPYGVPAVELDQSARADIGQLLERMRREESERGLAHEEALLACVKLLLIVATRLKGPVENCGPGRVDPRHPLLGELKEAIERNYQSLHGPADYAAVLNVSPKALGRVVREHLGKSLTTLIRERIITHAKWQLLHTLRPVKEIAREVGFRDELYFSRLFKKATGVSPTFFREFETEIRGGSNLSMR